MITTAHSSSATGIDLASHPMTGNKSNAPAQSISIWIEPAYDQVRDLIFSTFSQLARSIGFDAVLASGADEAEYAYGREGEDFASVEPAGWIIQQGSEPRDFDGLVLPEFTIVGQKIDPLRAALFFLSGEHEKGIEQSGDVVPGEKIARWGLLDKPTAHILAQRAILPAAAREGLRCRPRWPNGKKWALCLSHDCDRPFLHRPDFFARDAVRSLSRGKLLPSLRMSAQALYAGLAGAFRPDPYVESIEEFIELERSIGIRGTYFVGVWSRFEEQSSPHDLPYRDTDRAVCELVKRLVQEGCEVGLHSGIQAWQHEPRFRQEFERFENAYGVEPAGIRAHFWSIDSENNAKSFSAMAAAGFTYDSSLGMNEVHGYRRGMNYPYVPFDRASGESTGLCELPVIMMDDSVLRQGSESEWMSALDLRIRDAREHGGCLVLDWHTDTMTSPRWGKMTRFVMEQLRSVAEDNDCWLASGREIADWAMKGRWND